MTITTTTTPSTREIGTGIVRRIVLSDYLGSIESEGEQFAAAAEAGSLDAPIATCPGWAMRDLVRHLGEIHLWAAANIAFPSPRWLHVADLRDLVTYWPDLAQRWPRDDELVSWYRATLRNLIDVLETAPTDVRAFTFLPAPTPLMMWARRQASEIAIHRFDAEQAVGTASSYDPRFAADMLDELLSGFATRMRQVNVDREQVLLVDAVDVGERWWVTIGPGRIGTLRRGGHADLTIAGTAAELYLSLWNRTSDRTVRLEGDCEIIDLWHETCRVEWLG